MYSIIAYSAIFLLYLGIMVYRLKNKAFRKYIREHTGFIFIFVLFSLTMQVPIALKVICTVILLANFIYGRTRKE